MIRGRRVQRTPVRTVTRRTVATECKGLAARAVRRYQAAVIIVTGCTRVMRVRVSAGQRCICMTVGTGSRIDLHQGSMIRGDRRMRRGPTQGMTRLAVARR